MLNRSERVRQIVRGAALVVMSGALWLPPTSKADGMARDADGSRMQARVHPLRTTQQDSLRPPLDSVDWRTFKLQGDAVVTVRVTSTPKQVPVQVQLTDGRGNVLVTGGRAGGETLRRQLASGLYYVSVSASAQVDYSITIE